MWNPSIPDGYETAKIRFELVPYTRGLGLDIGCGPDKGFPHFIGIDNNQDERIFGEQHRATTADMIVPDGTKLPQLASEQYDFVYSSHMLEHVPDFKACLKEWWRLIKVGGHLVLYLPHKELYPNVGTPAANPDHKHDFLPADIVAAMEDIGHFDLVRNEDRNEDEEYSFFQVFKKLSSAGSGTSTHVNEFSHQRVAADTRPQAWVVRYGAYGDMMQSVSVLPGLREQGYRIKLYCSTRGYETVSNDPHVDEFVIQDDEQVPQYMINYYFEWMRKVCERRGWRFVNLCETVEQNFLPAERNSHFHWPKAARHAHCNKNYVEIQHMVAEVPYAKPLTKFYPTIEEKLTASDRRRAAKGKVVVFALAGSSVHKVWPGMDTIIARLLIQPDPVTIVLVGGPECFILEGGWQNEPRVWKRSGVWSIRESLAFCQKADVVIGGETGVLNAVAMEPMAKILFLSHSTVENLCRDWVNTAAFAAEAAPCYPCHRIHFNYKHCVQGKMGGSGPVDGPNDPERGVALCQEMINPETVWQCLSAVLGVKDPGLRAVEFKHGRSGTKNS